MALLLTGKVSDAQPPYPGSDWAPYSVTLEDEGGNSLRTFRQRGTTFTLGYEGERYAVRLWNHSDRRVEAVLTVDGRDAISGGVGDFVRQRGYIVPAHGSVLVEGFRQSLDRTAAFRFSRPSSSYSARMGTPENVGVVGVAFFSERRPIRRPRPLARPPVEERSWPLPWDASRKPAARGPRAEAPAPSPEASARDEAPRSAPKAGTGSSQYDLGRSRRYGDVDDSSTNRLGTEYGESTYSPVTEVAFVRRNPGSPDAVLTTRYDDADGLMARGIDVYPDDRWTSGSWERTWSGPEAFPRNRFAPPPP